MSDKSKPLGPPSYTGPTGQITAETLALVAALAAIRAKMKEGRG